MLTSSRLQLLPPSRFSPDTATPARRQRNRYVLDRLPGSSSPVSEPASTSNIHTWTAATTASYSNSGRHQSAANVRPKR